MIVNDSIVMTKLESFQQQFRQSTEPSQTLFDIIGRSTREEDWQRLLAYFLRPAEGHGFETTLLDIFLRTIENNTSITGLDGPRESIRIDVEVQLPSKKRVDLFLSQEGQWFLCIELKVEATEHDEQTISYVNADYIGTRAKSNFPTEGHHYLYLTADAADKPRADEFEHLTWNVLEERWRHALEQKRGEDGSYPTRGVAQFAEFLTILRTEAGEPLTGMETYYRDIPTAKRAYENLARSLAAELEQGIRARTKGRNALRIRRKHANAFPEFAKSRDRLEIDKPFWQVGRNKPTILYELNFHLHPYQGPGETQHRPSVAVYLDIRGGNKLKQALRESFENSVTPDRYRSHGFGQPHTNTKWHFLCKEVMLDETDTPVTDLLEAFDVLYELEPVLDKIARQY